MTKFMKQVLLLTQKNLRIRFSHSCLTFCELVIPLLITALIGVLTSYYTAGAHGGRSYASSNMASESTSGNNPEDKFTCHDAYYPIYNCELTYIDVASQENMDGVRESHITYILPDSVKSQESHYWANLLMTSLLKEGKTNWTRSNMSETELESCILHDYESCRNVFAVVVIAKIQDEIPKGNQFEIEYKIRMTDSAEYMTDKLWADYSYEDSTTDADRASQAYLRHISIKLSKVSPGIVSIQAFMDIGIANYIQARKHENKSLYDPMPITDNILSISLIRMPYIDPGGAKVANLSRFVSVLYSLLTSLSIFNLMRVNSEKCSGFKELLRMHGVSTVTQWIAWLVSNLVVYFIWTLILALLLCLPLAGGTNLIPRLDIHCFLFWLLLFLFMMSITTFSFLVSVFFERVWTAASVGLVLWIVLTVVMMVVNSSFHLVRNWTALCLMVVPTVAFDFSFRLFLNGGGTLETFTVPVIENGPLTALHCLSMLLFDCFIFLGLTVYLDNVLPAKYGVSKSPLFVVHSLCKFVRKFFQTGGQERILDENVGNEEGSVEMTSIFSQEYSQPFQTDPKHVEAAVVIQNLRKQYKRGKKRAVDGLTVKMFQGEIFALLGFNGAGKTTTIGVLTGLTAPTEGSCRIFDLDVRQDMDDIRKKIGLCPQHNLLVDEMSVLQQVAFFGKLKGLQDSMAKAKEILIKLGLESKLSTKPKHLSAGQKRRAHLAIALIGDTKLAFLDEPTSGLDPETRRGVWDILLKLRGEITLVLTTHDMEEADILGDRIGIMSEGKLMCCGTPSFLKRHYGVGYNLKMRATTNECDPEKVFKLVQKYVLNAKQNQSYCRNTQENSQNSNAAPVPLDSISICLPTADLDTTKLADLMDTLQAQKSALGVDAIGLSLSTMDEVFLKVGEAVHAFDAADSNFDSYAYCAESVTDSRLSGSRLFWYRYSTLVLKKFLYFLHAPWTMLFMLLLFSTVFWLTLTMLSLVVNTSRENNEPPRVVSSASLASYRDPLIFLQESTSRSEVPLKNTNSYLHQLDHLKVSPRIHQFSPTATKADILNFLKRSSVEDLHQYRSHYLVGASFRHNHISAYFSAYAIHSAPLTFNLISQTLIKQKLGVDAQISVVNHPFKHSDEYWDLHYTYVASVDRPHANFKYFMIKCGGILMLVVISSLLLATSALLPTEERLNNCKQLQLMTGTQPWLYWTATFSWDFVFFSVVNGILTFVYYLADYTSGNWLYTNNGAGLIIFFILECHTFAVLWFCYLISWAPCIKTAADGFLIINKIAVIVGCLWSVLRQMLIYIFLGDAHIMARILFCGTRFSGYIMWLVPMYSLYLSMMKLVSISVSNSFCYWIPEDILRLTCDKPEVPIYSNYWLLYSCCDNCIETGENGETCFKSQSYFNLSSTVIHNDYEIHSLIYDILAMLASGIVCAGLLFALEYRNIRNDEQASDPVFNATTDQDVRDEAVRIRDICRQGNTIETANHALICDNVSVNFGDLKAVNCLSFGVYPGECFGLLGQNGAGKTVTFRVITGDLEKTSGNVYAGGLNIYEHRHKYLRGLGYVPQFDGIIGALTGLQMLRMFGRLRGISPLRLEEMAKMWLDKFGLLGDANKKCGEYSGGMKRLLSASMAMIGNPKLLLLDEPTAGVDPAFRRKFWNVIEERRRAGQSILLTSHSMDECEALCTRLGIMVGGQLSCLGNTQHLKSKFGKGYILTVKLSRVAKEFELEHDEKVEQVLEKITTAFPDCRIQTKQKVMVQYRIQNKALWYSDILRKMQEIQGLPDVQSVIEEYSVTQTTLEDVFISFVSGNRVV